MPTLSIRKKRLSGVEMGCIEAILTCRRVPKKDWMKERSALAAMSKKDRDSEYRSALSACANLQSKLQKVQGGMSYADVVKGASPSKKKDASSVPSVIQVASGDEVSLEHESSHTGDKENNQDSSQDQSNNNTGNENNDDKQDAAGSGSGGNDDNAGGNDKDDDDDDHNKKKKLVVHQDGDDSEDDDTENEEEDDNVSKAESKTSMEGVVDQLKKSRGVDVANVNQSSGVAMKRLPNTHTLGKSAWMHGAKGVDRQVAVAAGLVEHASSSEESSESSKHGGRSRGSQSRKQLHQQSRKKRSDKVEADDAVVDQKKKPPKRKKSDSGNKSKKKPKLKLQVMAEEDEETSVETASSGGKPVEDYPEWLAQEAALAKGLKEKFSASEAQGPDL